MVALTPTKFAITTVKDLDRFSTADDILVCWTAVFHADVMSVVYSDTHLSAQVTFPPATSCYTIPSTKTAVGSAKLRVAAISGIGLFPYVLLGDPTEMMLAWRSGTDRFWVFRGDSTRIYIE